MRLSAAATKNYHVKTKVMTLQTRTQLAYLSHPTGAIGVACGPCRLRFCAIIKPATQDQKPARPQANPPALRHKTPTVMGVCAQMTHLAMAAATLHHARCKTHGRQDEQESATVWV